MRFPKGLRVRTRVEGEDWIADSLAMGESLVMGSPFVAKISITVAWSVVSWIESGWVVRKEDQDRFMMDGGCGDGCRVIRRNFKINTLSLFGFVVQN